MNWKPIKDTDMEILCDGEVLTCLVVKKFPTAKNPVCVGFALAELAGKPVLVEQKPIDEIDGLKKLMEDLYNAE